jgi:hypothetical protein
MTPTEKIHTTRKIIGWTQEYRSGKERGDRFRSFVAELDDKGDTLQEADSTSDGKLLAERTFAPPGRLSEERCYRPDGTLNFKNLFRYDLAGRKSQTVMYTAGGEILGRWISRYDGAGRLERETRLNGRGEMEVEDQYEYRDGGRTVTKTRGSVAAWTSTHDANGKLLTVRGGYFSADEADDSALEYDDHGRLTKKTAYSSPGVVRRITTYSYD